MSTTIQLRLVSPDEVRPNLPYIMVCVMEGETEDGVTVTQLLAALEQVDSETGMCLPVDLSDADKLLLMQTEGEA